MRACTPISQNDEITISYLGLFSYAEKLSRQSILQKQKLFTCSCAKCMGEDDVSARIPCFKCHKRIKNVLDEDVSWGDGDIHYIAPGNQVNDGNTVAKYKPCDNCNSTIDMKEYDTIFQLMKQICNKVTQRMQTTTSKDMNDGHEDDCMIQHASDEEYDEQLYQTSSSILGIKHWCTNFMLSSLLTRSLTTLHSNMILQQEEDSPDLELIAECIDSYQTYKTFLTDLSVNIPVQFVTTNFLIGIIRCLVSLGDEKSLNYALQLLHEGSGKHEGSLEEYVALFGCEDNGGDMVHVVRALKDRCLALLEEQGVNNKKSEVICDESQSSKRLKTG